MNRSKRGRQYQLPDSLIRWLVLWKQLVDYRASKGSVGGWSSWG